MADPPGKATRSPPPWCVVVAEDDTTLRTLLVHVLQTDPRFEVVGEAEDGVEALQLLRAGPEVDLLVLDIAMPRMDGLAVLAELRGRHGPTVAVLTGMQEAYLEQTVRDAGADAFLEKGAMFGNLADELEQLLV